MAVKNGNMFGKGGKGFDQHIKHDLLTGRMFTQGVIENQLKALRQELNVESKASMKDPVSYAIRKALAAQGVQPIDSVSGHFVGCKVSEREAGDGVAREAALRLQDADSGDIDTVVLNLNSGAGQMAIQKLKHVAPGEQITLKLFSSVSEPVEEGGKTFVNHYGAINRADGSKVTLDDDAKVKALYKQLTDERNALTAKKASKELVSATISSIKVNAALDTAKAVEAKVAGFKLNGHPPATNEAFSEQDTEFGDAGFDNGGAGKSAAPKA